MFGFVLIQSKTKFQNVKISINWKVSFITSASQTQYLTWILLIKKQNKTKIWLSLGIVTSAKYD